MSLMIDCQNLVKIYKTKEIEVVALQGLDLAVEEGELMAIIGNSGSGKSTLLNMLGGLDRPSAGKLIIDNRDMLKFTEKDYIKYKREVVGFIWQNNARNLVPYLTATENIELPMILKGKRDRGRALELLDMVGLSYRKKSKLNQLSGGEQQRVAIAISLANDPRLVLADEPTGSVDSRTASTILDIFRDINRALGVTIIIVTHDMNLSRQVDRVVAIRDGRTSSEFIRRRSILDEMRELEQEEAAQQQEQVEYAVLDPAGRLQIPRDYLDALGVSGKNKMRVELEEGRVVLLPPDAETEQHKEA